MKEKVDIEADIEIITVSFSSVSYKDELPELHIFVVDLIFAITRAHTNRIAVCVLYLLLYVHSKLINK